jgi:hypothetical protein
MEIDGADTRPQAAAAAITAKRQAIPQGWKLQGWQLKAGHEKRSE